METKDYQKSMEEFRDYNLTHWNKVESALFPNGVPETASWTNPTKIIEILNLVAEGDNANHTFHPDRGGLDLEGAGVSTEPDCIELYLISRNRPTIVKPKRLIFNSFPGFPEWSYFLLETGVLSPSGVSTAGPITEELTEFPDGRRFSLEYWDNGEYNGQPLPEGTRAIARVFSGSFAIFQKSSPYNQYRSGKFDAYKAFHNKGSADDFRELCKKWAKQLPSMIQS